VSFLRRILGGGAGTDKGADAGSPGEPKGSAAGEAKGSAAMAAAVEIDEHERERQLLRAEAERLDDDLIQRQLRYADRSWTPPAQGGTRRAEDGDPPTG
jgi:hypothetical protein